jgi:hypothetical protein
MVVGNKVINELAKKVLTPFFLGIGKLKKKIKFSEGRR